MCALKMFKKIAKNKIEKRQVSETINPQAKLNRLSTREQKLIELDQKKVLSTMNEILEKKTSIHLNEIRKELKRRDSTKYVAFDNILYNRFKVNIYPKIISETLDEIYKKYHLPKRSDLVNNVLHKIVLDDKVKKIELRKLTESALNDPKSGDAYLVKRLIAMSPEYEKIYSDIFAKNAKEAINSVLKYLE